MTNEEIIEKLKGKEVYGFKFYGLGATDKMDDFLGKVGVIIKLHHKHTNFTLVEFDDDRSYWYWYPTQELEQHLVEEEIDIKDLLNQIIKQ